MMTENEFKALSDQGYNRIALVERCLSDLDTPLSVYLKLADRPGTFLLESVQGGTRFARYSFIGLAAKEKIRVRLKVGGGYVTERVQGGEVVERDEKTNPLDYIDQYLKNIRAYTPAGLPRFTGGFVGYFGYDTVRLIEPGKLPSLKADDLGVPDIDLMRCDELVAFDNLAGRLYLIINADPKVPDAYLKARRRMENLKSGLLRAVSAPYAGGGVEHECHRPFAKSDYLDAVQKAKDYIAAGEVMQVQIGQRIERVFTENPITLYRALRTLNPSPYMYFYHFDDFYVVGASPEILVQSQQTDEGQIVGIRPIAGTRARGTTPEADRKLAEELLGDAKERAEHLMLIDLARNDIGRIAKVGSVRVPEQYAIERYSQVQHIVSHVVGVLRDGMSNIDVLKATFPAGTLTGAPKVRAMQIIDELEPVKRGIYGGAVGYLSYAGDMDMAIAIRTALIKDKRLFAQAAAGIVADSVPEFEWKETEMKARAVLRAAEETELGLEG